MPDIHSYTAHIDGHEYNHSESLEPLLGDAQAKFAELSDAGTPVSMAVYKDGTLVAFDTNRRITAKFLRQTWGGPKNNDALPAGEESFDATHEVLLLELERIRDLADDSELSDAIGRSYVTWSGPCCVIGLELSILDYFGVLDPDDLTEEHLRFAVAQEQPKPFEEKVLELTIKVKVRAAVGASLTDFVENLNYDITSRTPGILVDATEVIGHSV